MIQPEELLEETGIQSANIIPGFQLRTEYQFSRKGNQISKQVHWFIAETDEIVVNLSNEHIGFLWLSWDEALDQLTFDNSKNVLSSARKFFQER